MRCDDASEFVSAIFDGEAVPLQAAEHMAHCADCQKLLKCYAEMGATLRSHGSLIIAEPVLDRTWLTTRNNSLTWLEKGLQMMRIPRIAFACLVLLLIGLGSRLALVEVRAHEDGPILLLKLTPAHGDSVQCFVPMTNTDHENCGGLAQIDQSNLFYSLKAIKKDGDRVLLSIRSKVDPIGPAEFGPETASTLPETQSWFTPGETLSLPNTGELKLALTGQWTDHIPVAGGEGQLLDPAPNEIKLNSPLLLKNKKLVGDMENATAHADQPGDGVSLYFPGEGRFIFSLAPITGAIETKVQLNRVSFESNGQNYILVSGTPISRTGNIWVLHEAAYKPSPGAEIVSSIGAGPVNKLR